MKDFYIEKIWFLTELFEFIAVLKEEGLWIYKFVVNLW